jgi:hypothetical protein
MGWISNYRAKRSATKILNHPAVIEAAATFQSYLTGNGKTAILHQSDQSFRNEQTELFMRTIIEILSAENPILRMRKALAVEVINAAEMEVLIKPYPDKEGKPICHNPHQAISYTLFSHYDALVQVNKRIREMAFSVSNDLGSLQDLILIEYELSYAKIDALDVIRCWLNDNHPNKELDWLRPFHEAMRIWAEDQYREELGLPSLIAQMDSSGDLAGLKYSTYFNFVIAGERYPNLAWQDHSKAR